MHLQGERQDRMNALMERAQELGMRFTHSVTDPAALGTLQLRGALAGERGRSLQGGRAAGAVVAAGAG